MKDGFIKVAAAGFKVRPGDIRHNGELIIDRVKEASAQGIKILVFPELSLTGCTLGDMYRQDIILRNSEKMITRILQSTSCTDVLFVFGAPLRIDGSVYDCAMVMKSGEILGCVPKKITSAYSRRAFSPYDDDPFEIVIAGEETVFGNDLLFCCEDMEELKIGVEISDDLEMAVSPAGIMYMNGATLVLNPSGMNETVKSSEMRRLLIRTATYKGDGAYIMSEAGAGESTTDLVYLGEKLIFECGKMLSEGFDEDMFIVSEIDIETIAHEKLIKGKETIETAEKVYFDMEPEDTVLTRHYPKNPFIPEDGAKKDERMEKILDIQAAALRRRLEHIGSKDAVIGVSGGLDSTLAVLVAVRTFDVMDLPRKNIHTISMPCFGTSSRTKSNAEILCEELGTDFRTVDISRTVKAHFEDIEHDGAILDAAFENAQARERTQVLMDTANMCSGIVIGTGDLSELALGWATYNGDHMSMYSVNGSVPKTLIREVVRHVADFSGKGLKDVLYDIIDTPISPELLPSKEDGMDQKTEDIVGPYELHDFYLYYFIRYGMRPEKIARLAEHVFEGEYDRTVILKWMRVFFRRFFSQQFKRNCLPDGPKVGSVSLSPRGDMNMPSDMYASEWMKAMDKMDNL